MSQVPTALSRGLVGAVLLALMSVPADAQTVTYHLHREPFTDAISRGPSETATTDISKAPQLTIGTPGSPSVGVGSVLLAHIAIEGFGEGDVICTPSGWTLLRRDNNSSSTAQALFWRVATSSEPAAYTWQFRAGAGSCGTSSNTRQVLAVGGIAVYRGVDVNTPIFAHSGAVGSSTTINSPTVPNAPAAARLVSFFSNNKEFAIATSGGSSTQIYSVSVPKPPGLSEKPTAGAADAAHPNDGTTALVTAGNSGNSANWVAQTVVLTPANVLWRLKTAAPDNPSTSATTQNLRGKPAGDYLIREFATEPSVPNSAGTIPSGSVVSVTLWMKKSGGPQFAAPYAEERLFVWTPTAAEALKSGPDRPTDRTWWDSGLAAGNCKGVDQLLKQAEDWPDRDFEYREVGGPNSNTVARILGEAGGFHPSRPPGGVAWSAPNPLVGR